MRSLLLAALLMFLAGCGDDQQQAKKPAPLAPTTAKYLMYPSGNDVFLLNTETGKVWKYDAKKSAFLEVPVTSEKKKLDF